MTCTGVAHDCLWGGPRCVCHAVRYGLPPVNPAAEALVDELMAAARTVARSTLHRSPDHGGHFPDCAPDVCHCPVAATSGRLLRGTPIRRAWQTDYADVADLLPVVRTAADVALCKRATVDHDPGDEDRA